MRSESELAVSTAVITLMRGVVYRESHEAVWQGLLRHGAPVRDHFATIGVDVVLDETEGYAYLRSRDEEDALPASCSGAACPTRSACCWCCCASGWSSGSRPARRRG